MLGPLDARLDGEALTTVPQAVNVRGTAAAGAGLDPSWFNNPSTVLNRAPAGARAGEVKVRWSLRGSDESRGMIQIEGVKAPPSVASTRWRRCGAIHSQSPACSCRGSGSSSKRSWALPCSSDTHSPCSWSYHWPAGVLAAQE